MKVPGSCPLTEPQERSAEPKVEEKNSAKEARGLRYAEAAEELGTAGAAAVWAAFGSSPRTFQTTISSESRWLDEARGILEVEGLVVYHSRKLVS